MNIIKMKGCKRCGGDLFLDRDFEGTYIVCLQCSAIYEKNPPAGEKKPVIKRTYAR
ncbi:MAG: hypothetical protein ABR954_03045 [Dehalococcoidales bacterium]|jgi:DNA-directed RNA polymerase subunit M/transcription elongation factor TFIIS